MPSNTKKSAFYFFAKEYAERNRCNIKVAIENSYAEWRSLTADEKAPYEKLNIENKEQRKRNNEATILANNYIKPNTIKNSDTYGSNISLNKARNETVNELQKRLKNKPDVRKQKFNFIKFQTFCKTEEEDDERYVLAEVGLVEYSLLDGITRLENVDVDKNVRKRSDDEEELKEYHEFIKPAAIPPGYTATCMDNSKLYHKIPLHFRQANDDYVSIYENIDRFIRFRKDNGEEVVSLDKNDLVGYYSYLPLFCNDNDIDETIYGIKWLRDEAEKMLRGKEKTLEQKRMFDNKRSFEVLDLQSLIMALAAIKGEELSFTSANDILSSYHYDYSSNSRCDYHENLGIPYCALGYVKRYTYIISDNLCPVFDIKVTTKHIPAEKSVCTTVSYIEDDRSKRLRNLSNNNSRNDSYEDKFSDIRIKSTGSSIKSINNTVASNAQQLKKKKVADQIIVASPIESQLNRNKYNILDNNDDDDGDDVGSDSDDDANTWTDVKSTTNSLRTNATATNSIKTTTNTSVSTNKIPIGRGRVFVNKKLS